MSKKLAAFLCWLPFVMMFLVFVPWIAVSIMMNTGVIAESTAIPILLIIMLFIFVWVASVWGVMIWLIIRTVKNPIMSTGVKVAWGFGLYMLNVIAFPIYWFVVIRKCEDGI